VQDTIDGFLSRKAQAVFPDALVVKRMDGSTESWLLQRKAQPDLGLGDSFHNARQALYALLKAERAGQ
jgi:hypothetical protein